MFLSKIALVTFLIGVSFAVAHDEIENAQPCVEALTISQWTTENVICVIQSLQEDGVEVHATSLRETNADYIKAFIWNKFKFDTTGTGLYKAGIRLFKSWDRALEAAGIDFREARDLPRWDAAIVVTIIKEIAEKKHPIHYFAVRYDNDGVVRSILKKHLKKDIEAHSLVSAAVRYWKSWDNALIAAGFAPAEVRPQFSWSKELVQKALFTLYENKVPLHTNAIAKDKSATTTAILKQLTGQEITGIALHDRAVSYFDSYDDALQAAGLDPEKIRKRDATAEWSKKKIITLIKKLNLAKVPLNHEAIAYNESDLFQSLAEEVVGKKVNGRALIGTAFYHFENWDNALKSSGLDPREFQIQVKWAGKKKALLKVIQHLHKDKVRLNYKNLESMSASHESLAVATKQWLGKPVAGNSILYGAKVLFGSWNKAVKAAKRLAEPKAPSIEIPPLEITESNLIEFIEHNLLYSLSMEKKQLLLRELEKKYAKKLAKLTATQRSKFERYCLFSNKSLDQIQLDIHPFIKEALTASMKDENADTSL